MKSKWPPLPENLLQSVKALVNVGYVFRRVLLLAVERPLDDVLVENALSLDLSNDVLNEWIEQVGVTRFDAAASAQVGVTTYDPEEPALDAVCRAAAARRATKSGAGGNGRSKDKRKPLRKGGERGTVKRR